MDYAHALNYIGSKQLFRIKLGLEAPKKLMAALGNPEKHLKIIHVAGTNGKGSTCAMIASILEQAGYKVGLYTQPYLIDYRERITINKNQISEYDLARIITSIQPYADDIDNSYFEIGTALAFQYFFQQKVDYAVIEVGMGGRLDATNVVIPLVSVITHIAFDHMQYLGDTIAKIAKEKAGIIKRNIPIITAEKGEALSVTRSVADSNGSKLIIPEKYEYETNLRGDFQKQNLNLAVEAIKTLNLNIPEDTIKKGLLKVYWPGRLDLRGNILLDCAHNPDGVSVLVKELEKIKPKHLILIFGAMKDKDTKNMLPPLARFASEIILTKVDYDRAESPENLQKLLIKASYIEQSPSSALKLAKSLAKSDSLILVAGSIYLVGAVLREF